MEFRLNQRHIIAINFLLIAGIAYFAARAVNDIVSQSLATAPSLPAAISGDTRGTGVKPRTYYDAIARRDIFNLVPQAQHSERIVRATDLHLKLLGTSLGTAAAPYAIIEDQRGEQSLYRVGDDIPDAGELVSVEKDRAIIRHGGQKVALEIPRDAMPGPVKGPLVQPPAHRLGLQRAFGPAAAMAARNGEMPDIDVDEEGPNRYAIKRDDIRSALIHSAQLFQQIKATPNIQDGKQNGFALSDIEGGSVFEDLGLEDGDLVTAVDGRPLQNPGEAIGLLSTLQNRPAVDVTVMRDGKPVQLHYDIR